MQASLFVGSHLRRDLLILLALAALGLLVPHLLNRGLIFIAGMVWINAVFGLSFNLLFGTSGVLSFGQAMFYAAGAYATAVLTQQLDWPLVPSLLIAAITGGLLAGCIGFVALRRSEGVYFSILTLAFAELVHLLVANTGFLGKNDGLSALPRPRFSMGGWEWDLSRGDTFYYVIVLVSVALIALLRWVTGTGFGRALQAIRQDPERAEFLGIPVQKYRWMVFTLAGAITAAAGSLVAPWAQIVTPDLAHWSQSTNPILYTLLGGSTYFWGPVLGAVALSAVFYVTRTLVGLSDLVTGLLLLLVVLALPGGMLGVLSRWTARSRNAPQKTQEPRP
ncbi:MAG: branched-chain amino acid ABC transporter permease [Acidovorax soli]|uniref:branched-chain amino acid ABC transporter permease n=1 Tax=Acidovorax soli TaxID=592050 RepID=UPI0026F057FE|nr:branched-chain amino acid ABC transporter permease [Acidovorax soli]MCM2346937.1 branched-chain amino acid ABC transporter permease [Acidovorax soli]